MKKGAPQIRQGPAITPKRITAGASNPRRRDRVKALITRMKQRREQRQKLNLKRKRLIPRNLFRKRLGKRKAALAFSAGVMGMSTAAMPFQQSDPISATFMLNDVRRPATDMKVSEAFKEALIEEEGVRERVYRDVAGYPTVGVGHLVTPDDGLSVGERVSYDRILDFLDADLEHAERAVARLAGDMPLYQHEFDALVDLVYNVGEGNVSPSESPRLNQAIAMRDYDGIAAELDYFHAAGTKAKGLVYRSERRAKMFTEASYEDPRPDANAGIFERS